MHLLRLNILQSEKQTGIYALTENVAAPSKSKILYEYRDIPEKIVNGLRDRIDKPEDLANYFTINVVYADYTKKEETKMPETKMALVEAIQAAGYSFYRFDKVSDILLFLNKKKDAILFLNYSIYKDDFCGKLTIRKGVSSRAHGEGGIETSTVERKHFLLRDNVVELLENGSVPQSLIRFLSF